MSSSYTNNFKLTEGSSVTLDILRGCSAQVVVAGHCISFYNVFSFLQPPIFPYIQNIAVLIFFLISGLLISYSTFRRGEQYSIWEFLIERFSRIYSAFLPAILFVMVLDLACRKLAPTGFEYNSALNVKTFVGNIFMLQDFPGIHITSFGSARPFWTLAVEWWIYIFFGFLFLVFMRANKRSLLHYLILLALLVVPVYNLVNGRGNGLTLYWIFGAMIYLMLKMDLLANISMRGKIMFLFSFLLLAIGRIGITMKEYEPIFAFLLGVTLMFTVDVFRSVRFPQAAIKIIKWNANYSYTLYLIHYSILYFLSVCFKNTNGYVLFTAGFLVSNILSCALGYFSETLMTKKVKTWLYSLLHKHNALANCRS